MLIENDVKIKNYILIDHTLSFLPDDLEMESSRLEYDTVTHPTELLITCTNADTPTEETELEAEVSNVYLLE